MYLIKSLFVKKYLASAANNTQCRKTKPFGNHCRKRLISQTYKLKWRKT